MSKISIEGNVSGTGTLTIAAPNTNSNYTLTLPTESGTVLTNNGNQAGTFSTLTVNSNNISADNSLGFRNRIINGDMRIDQRNAGAAVTVNSTAAKFPVDRFFGEEDTDGEFTLQQDSSAPAGFVNSIKATITTADGSLSGSQYAIGAQHRIEGTNMADLGWGSASAKTVTLSFWVRSSLTGTFGGVILNSANSRSYPFTYSISVADTWEYKTVTIVGDTSGTWLTTTGTGMKIVWSLGAGSTFSGTANSWSGTLYLSATGATSVIGTLNATWYITGVQLEVGSVATPFERRPFGTELALCQRYYWLINSPQFGGASETQVGIFTYQQANGAYVTLTNPVQMRSSPVISVSGNLQWTQNGTQTTVTNVTGVLSNPYNNLLGINVISGLTVGTTGRLSIAGSASGVVQFSAEL